jgi:hypothetical protein
MTTLSATAEPFPEGATIALADGGAKSTVAASDKVIAVL